MPLRSKDIFETEPAEVLSRVQTLATKVDEISTQVQALRNEVVENTRQVALLKAELRGRSNTNASESALCNSKRRLVIMRRYNTSHNREEVMAALLAQLEEGLDRNSPAYQQLQLVSSASSLHSIANLDCVDLLKVLLDAGLDANITTKSYRICGEPFKGRTMLHFAAEAGRVRVAQLLKDRGADINATDSYGNTPLMLAVKSDKLRMVKWLLDHGAEVNCIDNDGMTSLHWAVRHSQMCVVRYLVRAGIDTTARDCQDNTAYECCQNAVMQRYLSEQPH